MRLATREIGEGPKRAALVHGITGDGGTWFELAPWLVGQGYRVTLVDQRGHGASPRAATYRADDLAADLVETLPRGLDLIAGHSLGGRSLVLAAADLAPARAVYLDPAWQGPQDLVIPLPRHPGGGWWTADEWAPLAPGVSRAHLENALRAVRLFDETVLDYPLDPMELAGPPAVPSLVLLADPTIFVPEELRAQLESDGWVVRTVPGGRHDLHITDLPALQSSLADWV